MNAGTAKPALCLDNNSRGALPAVPGPGAGPVYVRTGVFTFCNSPRTQEPGPCTGSLAPLSRTISPGGVGGRSSPTEHGCEVLTDRDRFRAAAAAYSNPGSAGAVVVIRPHQGPRICAPPRQDGGLVAQGGVPAAVPGLAGSCCAMLDTPTPESGEVSGPVKGGLSSSARRLYSRVILGLKIPGRYYFITWTSSPQSPPIEKSWDPLRKWLKYKRPGACWCYCFTDEGFGVIHMVLRLGKGEQRLDVKEVRAHWERLHKAKQIRIDHVPESMKNNLAAYIGDQRAKRKLGGEMAWQDDMIRWRWSKGWLPKGFTKEFGRVWHSLQDISLGQREKAVHDWLAVCHQHPEAVMIPPIASSDNDLVYRRIPLVDISPGGIDTTVTAWEVTVPLIEYDRQLRKGMRDLGVSSGPVLVDQDDLIPEGAHTLEKWRVEAVCRCVLDECNEYNDVSERHHLDDTARSAGCVPGD